jgi:hypothetical protein
VDPGLGNVPDLEVVQNLWMPVNIVGVKVTGIILAIIALHAMLRVDSVGRRVNI